MESAGLPLPRAAGQSNHGLCDVIGPRGKDMDEVSPSMSSLSFFTGGSSKEPLVTRVWSDLVEIRRV